MNKLNKRELSFESLVLIMGLNKFDHFYSAAFKGGFLMIK